MFVLIWITVLVSLRGSGADTGAAVWTDPQCSKGFCITLEDGLIRAEAGLCVVIPCHFSTVGGFTPQHIVWYKCRQSKERCSKSDIIFNTDETSENIKSEFKGRVSLLEPDVSQRNCSIMINDLHKSDSGSYQLRVNGFLDGKADGFTFSPKTQMSVKDLKQKPTVMVPPLTEGQQATLTCTAPGLCSGSHPEITWMWRGAGEEDSHIPGNITAVSQRHSSSLTFNLSAKHHNTNVTCKISFTEDTTTEETVTLHVNYVKEVKIRVDKDVEEGKPLNLTCSVDSFPPSLISWTKSGPETRLTDDTVSVQQNHSATCQQEEKGICFLFISNLTAEDSGLYICNVKHLDSTVTEEVNITVIYKRKVQISGRTTIKEGDVLNLTCSVESFPPSLIMWTKQSSNTNLQSGISLLNHTGSATLFIQNVTVEDSGRYVCTAEHLNTTRTEPADVTVTWLSEILNGSGCVLQSAVLTCVCISEGLPLPNIKWPLLQNHREYSVITMVSGHTVNSTMTLTVNHHGNITVECVSSNGNEEAKANLIIQQHLLKIEADESRNILEKVSWLEILIAFLIGVVLTAFSCCLTMKCYRKQRSSGNLDETLEMVNGQDDLLLYDGQAEEDQTRVKQVPENGAVVAHKVVSEPNSGPKEVVYASINLSLLETKSPREAREERENTETEYAEIKTERREEKEDNDGEEVEILEDIDEELMREEDEEVRYCVPEEEKEAEEAVYSTVKELMDEI